MTTFPDRLLTQAAAPAIEPVTLAETKLFLRVDSADEDALITSLIAAARMAAEEYTRRSFITQSWKLAMGGGTPSAVRLPRGPVQSVASVTAYDQAGGATVISSGVYRLDASKELLVFDSLIAAWQVEVVYVAGYGAAAATVPQPLRQGMLGHIAQLYDRRGDAQWPLPMDVTALYAPFREVGV